MCIVCAVLHFYDIVFMIAESRALATVAATESALRWDDDLPLSETRFLPISQAFSSCLPSRLHHVLRLVCLSLVVVLGCCLATAVDVANVWNLKRMLAETGWARTSASFDQQIAFTWSRVRLSTL